MKKSRMKCNIDVDDRCIVPNTWFQTLVVVQLCYFHFVSHFSFTIVQNKI